MKRLAALALGALLTLSVVAPPAQAMTTAPWREKRVRVWTNQERAERGIRKLRSSDYLRTLARKHSVRMARAGRLWHSYSCYCGENVGVTAVGRLRDLFRALMRSDAHRANILRRSYRRIGVGVVRHDGLLWVTMIFRF